MKIYRQEQVDFGRIWNENEIFQILILIRTSLCDLSAEIKPFKTIFDGFSDLKR